MTLPAFFNKALERLHSRHRQHHDEEHMYLMQSNPPASYSGNVINTIYLQDAHGQVQVLVPGNRMLDLNQLALQLGRQFSALTHDELERIKQRHKLSELPALPNVDIMDSLVDEHLLQQPELFIIADENQPWQPISAATLRQHTTSSHIGNYSASITTDIHHLNAHQDLDDVHAAIQQFTPLRIRQRLAETLDLPPLPETAKRIIELRVDPKADTVSLAQAVEMDPGMAAQVVSWARSPYYGVRGEVKTVEDAVLRVLGFDLVINLALGLALGRSISVPKSGPHGYAPYWQQAVVTATLCGELVRAMPSRHRPNAGLAYLCGLLHNFGYLVLGHIFPPQFSLINRHIEANPHINRLYIERHLLGMTREQVSGCLMQQWHMPDELVLATRHQHNPMYTGDHADYAHLLYVASRSLRRHGFGDGPFERCEPTVLDALALREEQVDEITANVLAKRDNLDEMVSMLTNAA